MSKVLIVEDNELNRDMLSRRLERRGFEVSVAVDGQEGLSVAQSFLPDIILLDMSLPILDGWEAAKQLKAIPQTQHIPIIALTAHAMVGDLEKTIAVGCNDYDTKPINFPRLLEKIDKLIGSTKTT